MALGRDSIKVLFSRRIFRQPDTDSQREEPAEVSPEQAFLASIAHLPPEEQQKRLQAFEWYSRLAQRQGIIEAERNAEHYWETG